MGAVQSTQPVAAGVLLGPIFEHYDVALEETLMMLLSTCIENWTNTLVSQSGHLCWTAWPPGMHCDGHKGLFIESDLGQTIRR